MKINHIYHGDTLEILKTFPDESVNMILTDRRSGKKSKELNYDFGLWDQFKTRKEFLVWTEKWIKECFRILKPTGNFVSFFSKNEISHFEDILNKYGYVRQTLVWHKTNPVPLIFKFGFMSSVEFMSWATKQKGAKHTFNYKLGQHHNFIETPICMGSERTKHPAQKPMKVISWLINYLSNEKDIVLDPFLGSGTTAVVAKKLGRKYIGIELSEKYTKIAKKRLAQKTLWE